MDIALTGVEDKVCGPLYADDANLSASVDSAIACATASGVRALAGVSAITTYINANATIMPRTLTPTPSVISGAVNRLAGEAVGDIALLLAGFVGSLGL